MFVSRLIIVICLGLGMTAASGGQTLELPMPPSFPSEKKLRVGDPSRNPKLTMAQPTEAFPPVEVRSEFADSEDFPDQKELVSILKRKLPATSETIEVKDAPEWFQNMMQRIVRENVPDKYVQDKDWGKTDRRWDGLQVKRRGTFQWTTKRKWKEVNHGSWKRYEVTQIDPHEHLTMRIENVRDAGAGKIGFDVRLTSKLHVFGRVANWAKGVQVYNISADADADVELRIQCEVGMKLDIRRFPPDVVIQPEVTHADLDVASFQLRQVSKLKGPLVRQLSGSVHDVLLEKIEEKRDRLPQKINRQIAKNQDKMRLSLADFASSKWESLTGGASFESSSVSTVEDSARTSSEKLTSIVVPSEQKSTVPFRTLNSPQQAIGEPVPTPTKFAPSAERVELLEFLPSTD